jgi:hypothetical protein
MNSSIFKGLRQQRPQDMPRPGAREQLQTEGKHE